MKSASKSAGSSRYERVAWKSNVPSKAPHFCVGYFSGLLSGTFCGALNKGIQEIAKLIEGKTGIDINDVADNKLTESQWVKLKDFEFQLKWTHTDKPPALGRRPFASSLRH